MNHHPRASYAPRAVVRTSALCAVLILTGCSGGGHTPGAPTSPTLPPAPTPGVALDGRTASGVVTENGQPIADARVNAWVDMGRAGYSYWFAHGPVTTDAAGTYRMIGLPDGAQLTFETWRDGYQQQCAAPVLSVQGSDLTVNLVLVSNARATAAPESAPGFRSVAGTVIETTSSGTRPVSGVFIDYEPIMDFPAATTYSDANGRFGLCGLPADGTVTIGAGLNGRVAYVNVPRGQGSIDIVLP